jgi:hypothetical protein
VKCGQICGGLNISINQLIFNGYFSPRLSSQLVVADRVAAKLDDGRPGFRRMVLIPGSENAAGRRAMATGGGVI